MLAPLLSQLNTVRLARKDLNMLYLCIKLLGMIVWILQRKMCYSETNAFSQRRMQFRSEDGQKDASFSGFLRDFDEGDITNAVSRTKVRDEFRSWSKFRRMLP